MNIDFDVQKNASCSYCHAVLRIKGSTAYFDHAPGCQTLVPPVKKPLCKFEEFKKGYELCASEDRGDFTTEKGSYKAGYMMAWDFLMEKHKHWCASKEESLSIEFEESKRQVRVLSEARDSWMSSSDIYEKELQSLNSMLGKIKHYNGIASEALARISKLSDPSIFASGNKTLIKALATDALINMNRIANEK